MSNDNHLADLVRLIAGGDADALAELYDQTSGLVFRLAIQVLRRQDEAEEVVADVYTHAWRAAATFERGRGTVVGWLLMLTRSRTLDRLRARQRRPDLDARTATSLHDLENLPRADSAAEALLAGHLTAAVTGVLPPLERRLIELAFYEGYTHAELAAMLALPVGTIKTRIRSALIKMRRALAPPDIQTA